MMKNHTFTSTAVRPTGAITFTPDWFRDRIRPTSFATHFFSAARQWETSTRYHLNNIDDTLVVFSDGTYGVCSEDRLEAALAAYDIELVGDD